MFGKSRGPYAQIEHKEVEGDEVDGKRTVECCHEFPGKSIRTEKVAE